NQNIKTGLFFMELSLEPDLYRCEPRRGFLGRMLNTLGLAVRQEAVPVHQPERDSAACIGKFVLVPSWRSDRTTWITFQGKPCSARLEASVPGSQMGAGIYRVVATNESELILTPSRI